MNIGYVVLSRNSNFFPVPRGLSYVKFTALPSPWTGEQNVLPGFFTRLFLISTYISTSLGVHVRESNTILFWCGKEKSSSRPISWTKPHVRILWKNSPADKVRKWLTFHSTNDLQFESSQVNNYINTLVQTRLLLFLIFFKFVRRLNVVLTSIMNSPLQYQSRNI